MIPCLQGCYGTLKMDGGMVVTVCAGNNLSGGAAIRLYGSQGLAVIGVRPPLPPDPYQATNMVVPYASLVCVTISTHS